MDIDKLNRLEKHCEDTLKMRVSQSIKDEHAFTLELIHGFKSLQSELTKVKEERDGLKCCFNCAVIPESCPEIALKIMKDDQASIGKACNNWESNK